MKRSHFSLLLIVSIALLAACKKEKTDAPTLVGFWKGKYGTSTAYPSTGYSFLFRSNGTVRVFDGADTTTAGKAEGTYALTGSTITTTYTYLNSTSTYSTTAIVDPKFTFIEGTWGSGTNTTNGGKYFLNKQ